MSLFPLSSIDSSPETRGELFPERLLKLEESLEFSSNLTNRLALGLNQSSAPIVDRAFDWIVWMEVIMWPERSHLTSNSLLEISSCNTLINDDTCGLPRMWHRWTVTQWSLGVHCSWPVNCDPVKPWCTLQLTCDELLCSDDLQWWPMLYQYCKQRDVCSLLVTLCPAAMRSYYSPISSNCIVYTVRMIRIQSRMSQVSFYIVCWSDVHWYI